MGRDRLVLPQPGARKNNERKKTKSKKRRIKMNTLVEKSKRSF